MKKAIAPAIALTISTSALAESPYPIPKPDGKQRIQRTGTCPTGYVGVGKFCEALHEDTPMAYPKINGAPCPSGIFASGDTARHSADGEDGEGLLSWSSQRSGHETCAAAQGRCRNRSQRPRKRSRLTSSAPTHGWRSISTLLSLPKSAAKRKRRRPGAQGSNSATRPFASASSDFHFVVLHTCRSARIRVRRSRHMTPFRPHLQHKTNRSRIGPAFPA